ncbi:hypothetical protein ACSBR2_042200 [Camellia fascicularis]
MNSTPQLRRPLRKCVEFYKAVLGSIPTAVEALTKGNPKFAESSTVDAANEAEYCENSFNKSESPLTDTNKGPIKIKAKLHTDCPRNYLPQKGFEHETLEEAHPQLPNFNHQTSPLRLPKKSPSKRWRRDSIAQNVY